MSLCSHAAGAEGDAPVSTGGLVDHGHIVGGRLVMLHIPPIHKLQLAPAHQGLDSCLDSFTLLLPPPHEERLRRTAKVKPAEAEQGGSTSDTSDVGAMQWYPILLVLLQRVVGRGMHGNSLLRLSLAVRQADGPTPASEVGSAGGDIWPMAAVSDGLRLLDGGMI